MQRSTLPQAASALARRGPDALDSPRELSRIKSRSRRISIDDLKQAGTMAAVFIGAKA
jgi:hypothetical protein